MAGTSNMKKRLLLPYLPTQPWTLIDLPTYPPSPTTPLATPSSHCLVPGWLLPGIQTPRPQCCIGEFALSRPAFGTLARSSHQSGQARRLAACLQFSLSLSQSHLAFGPSPQSVPLATRAVLLPPSNVGLNRRSYHDAVRISAYH